MREQPEAVLKNLEQAVLRGHRIVVSAITYSEMRFGATGPKASPRHVQLVDAFCARLDAILPWDRAAVDRRGRRACCNGTFQYVNFINTYTPIKYPCTVQFLQCKE